jgi:hypothetical protein
MIDLLGVLARARSTAEGLMREQVRLVRRGPDSYDENTHTTVPGATTELYSGKGRVKANETVGRDIQAGERNLITARYRVSLPWATTLPPGLRIRDGDQIEVTTSPDARLAGLILWVVSAEYGSTTSAWRLETEDRS